jgi:chromosome segregation ATPase
MDIVTDKKCSRCVFHGDISHFTSKNGKITSLCDNCRKQGRKQTAKQRGKPVEITPIRSPNKLSCSTCKEIHEENLELRKQNDELRNQNEEIRTECEHMRTECEHMRNELDSIRNQNADLRTESEHLKNENANLRNDLESLRGEFDRLRVSISDYTSKSCDDSESLRNDIKTLSHVVQGLSEENKKLKNFMLHLAREGRIEQPSESLWSFSTMLSQYGKLNHSAVSSLLGH